MPEIITKKLKQIKEQETFNKIKKQNGENFARIISDNNLLSIKNIVSILEFAGCDAKNATELLPYLRSMQKSGTDIQSFNFPDCYKYKIVNNQIVHYNFTENNIYFGPDFYCIGNNITKINKDNQTMMDVFVLDNSNPKQPKLLNPSGTKDAFIDVFNREIQDYKIQIATDRKSKKTVIYKVQNNKRTEIARTLNGQITKIHMETAQKIGHNFLHSNKILTDIDLPNAECIMDYFLLCNERLTSINLPKVKFIGNGFLCRNQTLSDISLPELESVGKWFLCGNMALTSVAFPKLQYIGDNFLHFNDCLTSIHLPKVKSIGRDFLISNKWLKFIKLPKLEFIKGDFLTNNNRLKNIEIPKIQNKIEKYRIVKTTINAIRMIS